MIVYVDVDSCVLYVEGTCAGVEVSLNSNYLRVYVSRVEFNSLTVRFRHNKTDAGETSAARASVTECLAFKSIDGLSRTILGTKRARSAIE